jgi:hypothetical protein
MGLCCCSNWPSHDDADLLLLLTRGPAQTVTRTDSGTEPAVARKQSAIVCKEIRASGAQAGPTGADGPGRIGGTLVLL